MEKITAIIKDKNVNYYQLFATGENEFSIPVRTMKYCIYPQEMLDEDGTLKTGQKIQLRKIIRTDGKARYYPAHDVYPPQSIATLHTTNLADNCRQFRQHYKNRFQFTRQIERTGSRIWPKNFGI